MDIMRSSFFSGINWESILARATDGPYVPTPTYVPPGQPAATSPSTNTNTNTNTIAPFGAAKELAGTDGASPGTTPPIGLRKESFDGFTSPVPASETHHKAAARVRPPLPSNPNKKPLPSGKKGEGDLSDDSDEDELMNLRDSIFLPSNRGGADNRLPDWSFIDAEVLMGSMNKKKTPRASSAPTANRINPSLSPSKVGVAGPSAQSAAAAGSSPSSPSSPADEKFASALEGQEIAHLKAEEADPQVAPSRSAVLEGHAEGQGQLTTHQQVTCQVSSENIG